MSHVTDRPRLRHRSFSLAASIVVFILIQVWAFGAFASPADPSPTDIYVTLPYVLGTLAGIVYKMAVGATKHLVGRTFRFRALFYPVMWSALLSFPLVFVIMPKFGRPTGNFMTDMIYAYLTTYAMIDMTADVFLITEIIRGKYAEAVDRDERTNGSHPPPAPPE